MAVLLTQPVHALFTLLSVPWDAGPQERMQPPGSQCPSQEKFSGTVTSSTSPTL